MRKQICRKKKETEKIKKAINILKTDYGIVTRIGKATRSKSIYFQTKHSDYVYRLSDHFNRKSGLNKVQRVVSGYSEFLVCCKRWLKINVSELDKKVNSPEYDVDLEILCKF